MHIYFHLVGTIKKVNYLRDFNFIYNVPCVIFFALPSPLCIMNGVIKESLLLSCSTIAHFAPLKVFVCLWMFVCVHWLFKHTFENEIVMLKAKWMN